MRWARDGFLAERFDYVLLVPLRSAQGRPVEDLMVKYIGGAEAYKELMKSAGKKCLVIFEGFDEISAEGRRSDEVLVGTLKECTLLEEATILVTSRPHACKNIKAGRTVEIVGFGDSEIKQFARKFFTDPQTAEKFLLQLDHYPHIRSLCYIPMNLVMIVDIQENKKKLPSTLTELYKLFVAMIIRRQIEKETRKGPSDKPTAVPAATEEKLHELLNGIPKDSMQTVFALSRLAYCSFFEFDWFRELKYLDPKIIFTTEDLTQCGIEVTADWDGYGFLKATPTHDVPVDTVTYNFAHLTIQEFLCALYISILSDQEQQRLLSIRFDDYPNVFIFFFGLTRLVSPVTSQFLLEKLKSSSETNALTALRCVYESGKADPPQSVDPFHLKFFDATFQPYDFLCIGMAVSFYPVLKLNIRSCCVVDSSVKVFEKNCSSHILQELDLWGNNLTVAGVGHVMKIVMKS